jgi:hypothetical protein
MTNSKKYILGNIYINFGMTTEIICEQATDTETFYKPEHTRNFL